MANDLNQCMFTGRLGADPESRSFTNGNGVTNLRLAVGEQWKDKGSGERKDKTEWVSVSIFSEGLRKIAEQYLKKGSKVLISGKMQTRKWQDSDGKDRWTTEIVLQGFDAKLLMLDGKRDGDSESSGGGYSSRPGDERGGQDSGQSGPAWGTDDDLDDSIPF